MAFAGVNYLAVIVAAVAAFVFGAVWYTTLGKYWLGACGKTPTDGPKTMPMGPLVLTFICQLVMAWVLAGLIGHLGPSAITLRDGAISGAFCWLGFVITAIAANYAFQGRPIALTVIDGGHWLGALVIEGAVIGAFGV